MNNKIYLVEVNFGIGDDYYKNTIFATFDKEYADAYVYKFNTILTKWKDYYTEYFQKHEIEYTNEYMHMYGRYSQFTEIQKAYITEIEVR